MKDRYRRTVIEMARKYSGGGGLPPGGGKRTSWGAVSIQYRSWGCQAARALAQIRFLSNEAPRLPLPDCSNPAGCDCIYRKHDDRRAGPRREIDDTGMHLRSFSGQERRLGRGRRKTDHL